MTLHDLLRFLKIVSINPPEFERLEPFLWKLWTVLKTFPNSKWRIKDLEILSVTLLELNGLLIIGNEFFPWISDKLDCHSNKDPRSGRCLIFILRSLLKGGYLKENLINTIFESANKFPGFVEEEMDVKVCLEFLFSLTETEIQSGRHLVEVKSHEMKNSPMMTLNAIKSLAEMDFLLKVNFPEYKGVRLDEMLRSKILQIDKYKPLPSNARENFLCDELRRFLGEKSVHHGSMLPYKTTHDIIFCVNDKVEAIEIPDDFISQLESRDEIVKAPVIKNYSWYVVICPKWDHVDQKGKLLGSLKFKFDTLRKLGYEVVIVQPNKLLEWSSKKELTFQDVKYIVYRLSKYTYSR